MGMTNAQLENGLRKQFLELLKNAVSEGIEADGVDVSASEFAIPCVDAENNERWVLVKVSVPRGTRNGAGGYTPYDGYAAAEAYELELEEKADKKAASEAKKQAKIARDEAKRAEKKAVAEARKGILELRNIPLNEKKGE